MGRIEDDFVEPAFGANRFERGLADDFELAFDPRRQARGESSRAVRFAQCGIDAASKDDALNAVGALQGEREHGCTGLHYGRGGLDNSIKPASGLNLNGHD
jgi:hypothetical protein